MPKFLVVDDEALARQKVISFLPAGVVVEQAANGLEALESLRRGFQPDIVFLDVEMPGLNGFELLRQLPARPFKIIFTTAYDEFAIDAFELNACDYLLKPFTRQRLHQSLARASQSLEAEAKLRALEKHLTASDQYLTRITVKQGDKLKLIESREIQCFVSQDHYTSLFTAQSEYLIDISIQRLAELLDPREFLRVHRKAIVRREAITEVSCGPAMEVALHNGRRVPVSRSHRQTLKELIR